MDGGEVHAKNILYLCFMMVESYLWVTENLCLFCFLQVALRGTLVSFHCACLHLLIRGLSHVFIFLWWIQNSLGSFEYMCGSLSFASGYSIQAFCQEFCVGVFPIRLTVSWRKKMMPNSGTCYCIMLWLTLPLCERCSAFSREWVLVGDRLLGLSLQLGIFTL